MCGICGYAGFHAPGLLEKMTASIRHRGPDDDGHCVEGDVGLGMRRLSIIDVAGGHQPITNEDESLVIVFNGEIYNYRPLREMLLARGHTFRTESDTEVILHLYEDEGPACLQRLNGMWGIAIWDRRKRRLFLARDRLGVKPLYYRRHDNGVLFASEMKALLCHEAWQPKVVPQALHQYLSLRYVPGPGSLLEGVEKLPAAHYAIWENGSLSVQRYWTPAPWSGPFEKSDREYLDAFAEHFERSVRMRLISEVPLGAYLSSGVDSSAIVAAMSRLGAAPVRTFTVGFGFARDEMAAAAETARQLGCHHTEIDCRPEHVDLLPEIIWHLDEPIGDPIVIPMFQLAREAKKSVTVILAGEGADELLGGYLFHRALLRSQQVSRVIPPSVIRGLVSAVPPAILNLAFDYPAALGKRGKQKLVDFAGMLDEAALARAWRHLISLFDRRDTDELYTESLLEAVGHSDAWPASPKTPATIPLLNRIIDLQFNDWLPDDILTKQDKVSMASGVEVRVPFLDYELVEFALRLPPHLKINRRAVKVALRHYASGVLPPSSAQRSKQAFYVPLDRFMREPRYRDMVDDALSERVVRERGWFRPDAVARLRERTLTGDFVHAKQVFSLLSLELWHRIFVDRRGTL
ncbi:MAG TPA: asparagine synthase (glutamine-hydrolyzing) [Gemmatimonadaceae bacterium]|nr:asparagine synthase (glutamine-hydrolyzing) [Gemmatimonadaceae bacterium]